MGKVWNSPLPFTHYTERAGATRIGGYKLNINILKACNFIKK